MHVYVNRFESVLRPVCLNRQKRPGEIDQMMAGQFLTGKTRGRYVYKRADAHTYTHTHTQAGT